MIVQNNNSSDYAYIGNKFCPYAVQNINRNFEVIKTCNEYVARSWDNIHFNNLYFPGHSILLLSYFGIGAILRGVNNSLYNSNTFRKMPYEYLHNYGSLINIDYTNNSNIPIVTYANKYLFFDMPVRDYTALSAGSATYINYIRNASNSPNALFNNCTFANVGEISTTRDKYSSFMTFGLTSNFYNMYYMCDFTNTSNINFNAYSSGTYKNVYSDMAMFRYCSFGCMHDIDLFWNYGTPFENCSFYSDTNINMNIHGDTLRNCSSSYNIHILWDHFNLKNIIGCQLFSLDSTEFSTYSFSQMYIKDSMIFTNKMFNNYRTYCSNANYNNVTFMYLTKAFTVVVPEKHPVIYIPMDNIKHVNINSLKGVNEIQIYCNNTSIIEGYNIKVSNCGKSNVLNFNICPATNYNLNYNVDDYNYSRINLTNVYVSNLKLNFQKCISSKPNALVLDNISVICNESYAAGSYISVNAGIDYYNLDPVQVSNAKPLIRYINLIAHNYDNISRGSDNDVKAYFNFIMKYDDTIVPARYNKLIDNVRVQWPYDSFRDWKLSTSAELSLRFNIGNSMIRGALNSSTGVFNNFHFYLNDEFEPDDNVHDLGYSTDFKVKLYTGATSSYNLQMLSHARKFVQMFFGDISSTLNQSNFTSVNNSYCQFNIPLILYNEIQQFFRGGFMFQEYDWSEYAANMTGNFTIICTKSIGNNAANNEWFNATITAPRFYQS